MARSGEEGFQSLGPWCKPDGEGRGRRGPPDVFSWEWSVLPRGVGSVGSGLRTVWLQGNWTQAEAGESGREAWTGAGI